MNKVILSSLLVTGISIAAVVVVPKAVDLSKTKTEVSFVAKLNVGGSINGKTDPEYLKTDPNPLTGNLKISNTKIEGSTSFKMAAFDTGIGMRTRHMKENYLEVAKYPEAKLTLEPITLPADFAKEAASQDGIPFKGKLNMHGKEGEVSGTLKAQKNKNDWDLSYNFPIDIKKFGIEIPKYMGVTVKDIVDVNVQVKG